MQIPTSHWIYPEGQEDVVSRLYEFGLLKIDNYGQLPLSFSPPTDIYIQLRNSRSRPESIKYLAELYSIPLRRLRGIDRFVEVPYAVSGVAGHLAVQTGMPYLSFRESTKDGRVSDSEIVGDYQSDETVCIIDDVISRGDAKISPHRLCLERGLNNVAFIVLVDRQHDWETVFRNERVNAPVWSGMTLHDVRRHLIQSLGVMKRCDNSHLEDINPIIVTLDGMSWRQALPHLESLRQTGCIIKVGDMVLDHDIESLIADLSVYGRVMIDLKLHDTPDTVADFCRRLKRFPPWAVTVHASGGAFMIKAAVDALRETPTKVLAVTLLTSLDNKECDQIYHNHPIKQVTELAKLALKTGVTGFVCSRHEAKSLRELAGPVMPVVVTGIRSSSRKSGGQKRVGTYRRALASGASHVVMGRELFDRTTPAREIWRILLELEYVVHTPFG